MCAGPCNFVRVRLRKEGQKVCRLENFCHANTRDDVAEESEIKSLPRLVIIL